MNWPIWKHFVTFYVPRAYMWGGGGSTRIMFGCQFVWVPVGYLMFVHLGEGGCLVRSLFG